MSVYDDLAKAKKPKDEAKKGKGYDVCDYVGKSWVE